MATIDNNLLIGDTSKNLGIPKTRRGVEQLLIQTLREKYGLVKNEDVSYGTIKRKYRKYSSKAGGFIDTRTGAKWDSKHSANVKATIKEERTALLDAKKSTRFGGPSKSVANALSRTSKFQNAQAARNQLSQHLQAKAQNQWHLRNLLSPKDVDTGKTRMELEWEKQKLKLEENVARLENTDSSIKYEVPENVLKIIQPQPVDTSGISKEEARIVNGDTTQVALDPNKTYDVTMKGPQDISTDPVSTVKSNTSQTGQIKTDTNAPVEAEGEAAFGTAKLPGAWSRKWAGGDGRELSAVNRDTADYMRNHGWNLKGIHKGDLDDLYADIRTGRAVIHEGKGKNQGESYLHYGGKVYTKGKSIVPNPLSINKKKKVKA